jgi:nitrogen fixation NifU-like protein
MTGEAYNDIVMEHFRSPRNAGPLPDANAVGFEQNPVCGDRMRLMLRIEDGSIAEARWQTEGCTAAIATSSIATEMIKGRPLNEVEGLTREDINREAGGLPASKLHCSVLAAGALRKALSDYRSRASA